MLWWLFRVVDREGCSSELRARICDTCAILCGLVVAQVSDAVTIHCSFGVCMAHVSDAWPPFTSFSVSI